MGADLDSGVNKDKSSLPLATNSDTQSKSSLKREAAIFWACVVGIVLAFIGAIFFAVVLSNSIMGSYNTGIYCQVKDASVCTTVAIPRIDESRYCPNSVLIGQLYYTLQEGSCEVIKPEG